MKVAGLCGDFLINEPSGSLKVHHVHHGLQQGRVKPLALTRFFALKQCHQNALCGKDTCAQVSNGNAHAHRAMLGQAGDRHQAAHALCNLIKAGSVGQRPCLTKA